MERSSGVFSSSASPENAQNAVGMHRQHEPSPFRFKNAGLVQSHVV